MSWQVDPDIRRARTPPPELYTSADVFDRVVDRVLRSAWFMTPSLRGEEVGEAVPFELLPGVLRTPLALVRGNDGVVRCLSNVCTHRANLVIDAPGCLRALRCRYHGRRFSLDGRFVSMPELEGAEDFPSASDDLPVVPFDQLGPIPFASLAPKTPFSEAFAPIRERVGFLPWSALRLDAERTYEAAIAALGSAVGANARERREPTGSLETTPVVSRGADELVRLAIENRADAQIARATARVARAEVRAAD